MNSGAELDRGLLLGDALFETVLVHRGRPFRLERHLQRLRDGAGRVGIPVPTGLAGRIAARLGRAQTGGPADRGWAALRITLTRGPGDGLAPPPDPSPGLHVTLRPIDRAPPTERPLLSAIRAGRIAEGGLAAGLKSTGYLERILALRMAHEAGADEALLLNSAGRAVEGTASNLFLVRSGVLHTPSITEGALPGITRAALLQLADERGIEGRVGDSPEPEDCDEAFLSSSLRGPIALVRLDETAIGDGRSPGPVFLELAHALEERIRSELAGG